MLPESARMSLDHGLVMQLHPGAVRNHDRWLYAPYGADSAATSPRPPTMCTASPRCSTRTVTTRGCPGLYTLDESAFSRELAPLAGGYPAVDSARPGGSSTPRRAAPLPEPTTETAGFYNTAGFDDDTRAFPSIPVCHDVARRVDCGFLARLVAEHRLAEDEAAETIVGTWPTGCRNAPTAWTKEESR